jgi:hypothetical protein
LQYGRENVNATLFQSNGSTHQAGHIHTVHRDGPAFLTAPIAVLSRPAIPGTQQFPASPEVREFDFLLLGHANHIVDAVKKILVGRQDSNPLRGRVKQKT